VSLTKKRWTAPGLTGDWVVDGPRLVQSINAYLLSLEDKGSLSIGEASITANQGIAFPATQVASTDANTLDDYEESLTSGWTPVDASGASLALTGANGTYIKVGALVVAWGSFTYPATADASATKIGGLPFTVKNVVSIGGGGMVGSCTETTLDMAQPIVNTSNLQFLQSNGNSVTNATMSGDGVAFCLIYAV
jgi:hypothetical protein